MDPNNNFMPGMSPAPAAPALTPTGASMPAMGVAAPAPAAPPTTSSMPLMGAAPAAPAMPMPPAPAPEPATSAADLNPAVTVANAAMAGATANVVTPDVENGTIPPAPMTTLPIPPEEEPTGPVNLAPSEGFEAPEVATVSAVQNGANPDLASQEMPDPMSQDPIDNPNQPITQDQAVDFNTGEGSEEKTEKEENVEPIEAAAPVPGSIGSAKSYIDIQRAEAERAARMATKGNSKLKISKQTIIIAAIGVVVLIGAIIAAVLMMSGGEKKPTQASNNPVPEVEPVKTELSCKRDLALEEYNWTGAVSGSLENIFYFADDELDGLATDFNYAFATTALAEIARNNLAAQYGVDLNRQEEITTEEAQGEGEEVETAAETETATPKTAAEMLKHDVILKDTVVTHHLEITSEDIKDWVASDAYSDATYGAEKKNVIVCPDGTNASSLEKCGTEEQIEEEEEPVRNLDYFRGLQNGIGFSCTVSK